MQGMIRYSRKAVWVCLWLALTVFGADLQAAGAPEVKTITVIGTGEILKDGLPAARERAIGDGLTGAVGRGIEDLLPPASLAQHFKALDETLYARPDEFIQNYKVLAETERAKKYRVLLQVTLRSGKLKAQIERAGLMPDKTALPKILLLVWEQDPAQGAPRYWWGGQSNGLPTAAERAIGVALSQKGYPVINPLDAAHRIIELPLIDTPAIEDTAALEFGKRLGADVVVVGSAEVRRASNPRGASNIIAFNGSVSARALRTADGVEVGEARQTAAATSAEESIGFRDALSGAGTRAGEQLADAIGQTWHRAGARPPVLEIVVQGTSPLKNFVQFRKTLKDIPGVQSLRIREMKSNEATLNLEYAGNTRSLADTLLLTNFGSFGLDVSALTDRQFRVRLISN